MTNSAEAAAEAPADEAPASGAAALGAVFPPALLDYVNTLLARQTREFELRLASSSRLREYPACSTDERVRVTPGGAEGGTGGKD